MAKKPDHNFLTKLGDLATAEDERRMREVAAPMSTTQAQAARAVKGRSKSRSN